MNSQTKIEDLIVKYLRDELTSEERSKLEEWKQKSLKNKEVFESLTNEETLMSELKVFQSIDVEAGRKKLLGNYVTKNSATVRKLIFRWAVAASVILVIGIGSYFLFFNKAKPTIAKTQQERFKNDVDPGKYKAKLTLVDGRTIILDSVDSGELAKQGNVSVMNKNGQLVYSPQSTVNGQQLIYNTLSTAKGESYSTVLSDGTKIWLNSASSIKFPVAFVGNERKVEITGEAYFEVKHNDKLPFKVVANGMEIEDLGTEFNVNAYDDESVISTTLVSGSVRVKSTVNGEQSIAIRPGEQVILQNNELKKKDNVDVEKITAWRNNVFMFSGDDIQTIMRQLARWYSVDVVYKNDLEGLHFSGIVNRDNKVSEVLKMLEKTGKVKFEIEGNKIVVSK